MGSSAITADERILDVSFSDDALGVALRDGRVISVPLVCVSTSAECDSCLAKKLENCWRRLRNSLARR